MTGPVPARVDANVKAGLLDLADDALEQGWSRNRACAALEIDDFRVGRWLERRADNRLDDLAPGGNPVHGLLESEIEAIVELAEAWGEIDRSHRKLAHRGSRLEVVYVSESTMLRVLGAQGLVLPGTPPREPAVRKPWPDWVEYRPNQVWGWDGTHFPRADRVALAIVDLVSRKWIATLVTAEETSIQVEVVFDRALDAEGFAVEVVFDRALDAEGFAAEIERRALASVEERETLLPLLLAVSDNGPQMTSGSTAEYMAL